MSGWDEQTLIHVAATTVEQVGSVRARLLDVIFDAATAFSNVRRLQLLRFPAERGPSLEASIVGELKMSPAACRRHTDKLLRRGLVRRQGGTGWALSDGARTPFHGGLTLEVLRRLAPGFRS
jgi:hypothetical protein